MGADSAEVDRFTNMGSRCSSPRLSDTTAASGAGPMSSVTPRLSAPTSLQKLTVSPAEARRQRVRGSFNLYSIQTRIWGSWEHIA